MSSKRLIPSEISARVVAWAQAELTVQGYRQWHLNEVRELRRSQLANKRKK